MFMPINMTLKQCALFLQHAMGGHGVAIRRVVANAYGRRRGFAISGCGELPTRSLAIHG